MSELSFMQTGLEVITDSLKQHDEAIRAANNEYGLGSNKLREAKELLAQAILAMDSARVHFQKASSIVEKCGETLTAGANVARAIDLGETDQTSAQELNSLLGNLPEETGKLQDFYHVHAEVTRTTLALLGGPYNMAAAQMENSVSISLFEQTVNYNAQAQQAVNRIEV